MNKLKALSKEQKNCWIENGYVKLSNIFSTKEIDEISKEYDDLFERKKQEDIDGLESAWIGDDMKKLSGYRNTTVKEKLLMYFT